MSADRDYLDPSQWMGTKELCAILGWHHAPSGTLTAKVQTCRLSTSRRTACASTVLRLRRFLQRQRKLTAGTQLRERAAAQATA